MNDFFVSSCVYSTEILRLLLFIVCFRCNHNCCLKYIIIIIGCCCWLASSLFVSCQLWYRPSFEDAVGLQERWTLGRRPRCNRRHQMIELHPRMLEWSQDRKWQKWNLRSTQKVLMLTSTQPMLSTRWLVPLHQITKEWLPLRVINFWKPKSYSRNPSSASRRLFHWTSTRPGVEKPLPRLPIWSVAITLKG